MDIRFVPYGKASVSLALSAELIGYNKLSSKQKLIHVGSAKSASFGLHSVDFDFNFDITLTAYINTTKHNVIFETTAPEPK